ncbi:MAG: hypothetical protein AAGH65_08840 [Pseudomonadota bacterium]
MINAINDRSIATVLALLALGLCQWSCCAWGGTHLMQVGDVRLDVQMDETVLQQRDPSRWDEWLRRSVDSVRSIGHSYPADELHVHLISTGGDEPVQFGRVRRSDPPQVHFYLNPDASLDELLDDWHSYHEFAHLLIPFPGNRDIWFTEGLASYYQYLLQARAGVISADQAWQRLVEGFERGINDHNGRGVELYRLSPSMWHEQAYRRVYWTGASFFLRVDTRLRTESEGRYSLDQVLMEFNQCCRDQRRRWNAKQLIDAFGQLSINAVWQEEYDASIAAPAEPEFAAAFALLGIQQRDQSTWLDTATAPTALRNAIALGQ